MAKTSRVIRRQINKAWRKHGRLVDIYPLLAREVRGTILKMEEAYQVALQREASEERP